MSRTSIILLHSNALVAILFSLSLPAAAQTLNRPPEGLASSSKMTPDASHEESWTYAQPSERFLNYRSVIVDPTIIYRGPDAQFEGIDQADLSKFSEIFTQDLRRELAEAVATKESSQGRALRLRVTLLGIKKTTGGLATATRVTPLGLASSAVKSALGKSGTFTGSVLYAVELFDSSTNELLLAAIRRRAPDPLDVPATLSTTDTIKAVARDLADSARKRIMALMGVSTN